MLLVMCNELVTDATPPVVNQGPNPGLMPIPYVCVSVPRSTKRYSSFADQPPPSLVSTPAPTVQPVRAAEQLAPRGRDGPRGGAPHRRGSRRGVAEKSVRTKSRRGESRILRCRIRSKAAAGIETDIEASPRRRDRHNRRRLHGKVSGNRRSSKQSNRRDGI